MNDYAVTEINGKPVYMHELIWVMDTGKPIPDGFRVEHVNGATLINVRSNLHLVPCEPGQEYMGDREATNTAGLKGKL